MFGFFLQTGQTLRLLSKATPLSKHPQLCCEKSLLWPDILPQVDQVSPQLVKLKKGMDNIPFFVPMKLSEGMLTYLDVDEETNKETKFCLMFYPDPTAPPSNLPIVKEYWSTIKPMIICRDISGYYLGLVGDENVSFFSLSDERNSDCWLKKITGEYSESLSFGIAEFEEEKLFIKRCRLALK